MKYVSAFISFAFVFAGVFFLAGWFLLPHLPPVPDHPVSAFEAEYWRDNWIGYLLGAIFGGLSALSVLRKPAKTVKAPIILLACIIYAGGCSQPSPGEEGLVVPAGGSPTTPAAQKTETGQAPVLEVKECNVTAENLRLDYCLKNPLSHEIWAGDPLSIKRQLPGVGVETRISGDTLHIDFRFDIPSRINMEGTFAPYRRLPSGESCRGTVLLDLPISENSFERFSMGVPRGEEEEAVVHRVVFEIGYFDGDLSAPLSRDLSHTGLWRPESDDPNVVFVPHWWKGLGREQSAQVMIDNIEVPVRMLRSSGKSP